jgi:type II secretory pathway pseudopilin PulG
VTTSARGVALIDVLCSVAVLAILAAVSVPNVAGSLERERAVVGAHALAGYVQRARFEALKRVTPVGLQVVISGDRARVTLYADGNGNGVLQRDIAAGIDSAISGAEWLDQHAPGVSLRINQVAPDIGGGAALRPGDNPVRIGQSSLLVFSPFGSSTSGTLYVAGARGPQLAVRVYGATGRTRLLIFNPISQRWE